MYKKIALALCLAAPLSILAQKDGNGNENVTPVPDFVIIKDPAFKKILPKNIAVEKVSTGYLFTEGPVWNKKENYLLFSDIPANIIFKLTSNGKSEVYKKPSQNSNGLTYDPKGRLVVCEQYTKRINRFNEDGSNTVLADKFEGKTFNSPNDIVFKKNGSFFFTDPPYGHMQFNGDKPQELSFTGVYFVKNNKVTLVDSTLIRANGVALSPDESKLYVAQSEFKWLWKIYNLDKEGKVLSTSMLMEGSEITGNPDGIKVDIEGNIYCTGNNGVVVFSKEGTYLGTIKTPENPANLAWGDKDFKSLYVTAQKSVYRIKLNIKGYGF